MKLEEKIGMNEDEKWDFADRVGRASLAGIEPRDKIPEKPDIAQVMAPQLKKILNIEKAGSNNGFTVISLNKHIDTDSQEGHDKVDSIVSVLGYIAKKDDHQGIEPVIDGSEVIGFKMPTEDFEKIKSALEAVKSGAQAGYGRG